eukprot:3752418-Rhodomonas_salina.1
MYIPGQRIALQYRSPRILRDQRNKPHAPCTLFQKPAFLALISGRDSTLPACQSAGTSGQHVQRPAATRNQCLCQHNLYHESACLLRNLQCRSASAHGGRHTLMNFMVQRFTHLSYSRTAGLVPAEITGTALVPLRQYQQRGGVL